MVTKKFIELIEANAPKLAKDIQVKLLTHPSTHSYQRIDEKTLYDWIHDVCSRFSYWLAEDKEKGEVEEYYTNLGKVRCSQDFALHEVISALYIIKRRLWEFIAAAREVDSGLNLNQIVETAPLVGRFFDHVVLHVTEGFEEMLQTKCGYVAPLQNPERLAEALAAKKKRESAAAEKRKLPTLCFTKGMIRLDLG
jgi:hypothetical protein